MYRLTTAVIGTVLIASTALAGEVPQFTTIDKDKDGYVSKDEARAVPEIMELFASVDVNKDNQLSTSEYMEAVKQLQG
jgi:Ca2+-binding EF-hand superfamily protein